MPFKRIHKCSMWLNLFFCKELRYNWLDLITKQITLTGNALQTHPQAQLLFFAKKNNYDTVDYVQSWRKRSTLKLM